MEFENVLGRHTTHKDVDAKALKARDMHLTSPSPLTTCFGRLDETDHPVDLSPGQARVSFNSAKDHVSLVPCEVSYSSDARNFSRVNQQVTMAAGPSSALNRTVLHALSSDRHAAPLGSPTPGNQTPSFRLPLSPPQSSGSVSPATSSSPEASVQRGRNEPILPPCQVCGDNASGYHYGANTCEACKVYIFRISLTLPSGRVSQFKLDFQQTVVKIALSLTLDGQQVDHCSRFVIL